MLARRPLAEKTLAAQVLATGTGALNVDGSRVATSQADAKAMERCNTPGSGRLHPRERMYSGPAKGAGALDTTAGRWPPNLLHSGDPEVLEAFARFGERRSSCHANRSDAKANGAQATKFGVHGKSWAEPGINTYADAGSAARFFPALGFSEDELRFMYCPKAGKAERAGSKHPTVKPLALMRWLCRLITPPGGTILDPFAGSGATGEAAILEGFNAILIEREAEYLPDIQARLKRATPDDLFTASAVA